MRSESLDNANIRLYQELALIKASLDIYKLIGLNASLINANPKIKSYFGTVSNQSLSTIVLGLEKIFERESTDDMRLCSVRGILRLAKESGHPNVSSNSFATKYGVNPTANWVDDIDSVLAKQRPVFRKHLAATSKYRNERLAHSAQVVSDNYQLPSITAFEQLLEFVDDFRTFINSEFLGVASGAILDYNVTCVSFLNLLRELGIREPISDFTGS